MNKIAFMTMVLLTPFLGTAAQSVVTVAPYYGGRQAALSLTFDDGLEDQYTLAYPELKRRGLRATFAIVGSKVGGVMRSKQDREQGTDGTPCMTWDMLHEMAREGMEISNHGWSHQAVTRLSDEALRHEVQRNDTAIYEQTGQFPRTFFYPGNAKNDASIAFCEQDRVGTRTFQTSIGSKRDTAWLCRWVDGLIEKGEWGVGMTHGIARGYDHFEDPQVMWSLLDYLVKRQQQVWVAPFGEVAAYVKERQHAQLSVETADSGLHVTINTNLDSLLFRHPLTLMLNESIISAEQDGELLPMVSCDSTFYVNIDPHGGAVFLRTKM
jgi:peptidoglycan/xylan/chitin deacetylase (PgdA/CDA1 family)